ncbi:MAG: efflux RND transporter periplasmic adaptor subunit [Desulfococcaceae bacterium]
MVLPSSAGLPQFCRNFFRYPAVFAGFLPLLLAGCGQEETPPPAMPPVAVGVQTVIQREVPVFREWIATTDGVVNATIRAQVQGYLLERNYTEGDMVKKGDVLFRIDARPFEATMAEAKAMLARRKSQLTAAEAQLRRMRPLRKAEAVSQKDLDDAVSAAESARADLAAAEAEVRKAELSFSFATITSPIDGIAGLAAAQVGDLVGPAATSELTTVSQVNPIRVLFPISEREYLMAMQKRRVNGEEPPPMDLELILADGFVWPHPGKFSVADRQIDPTTGTLTVAALFANPERTLRPGQYAKVRAQLRTIPDALLVPQRAVTEMQGNYRIAVVGSDNAVEVRTVKMGDRIEDLWVVAEGIAPGERVVVEGVQKVRSGMTVTPRENE